MKKLYHLTVEGKKELEAELEDLKNRRGAVAEKIANARDYGDLSENAEYDAAREEQGQVESRISEIEDIVKNADIIKAGTQNGTVRVGSVVMVKNGNKSMTYQIVGPVEADPLEGKISNESPIGEALLGTKVGDSVTIQTPKGATTYSVERVS